MIVPRDLWNQPLILSAQKHDAGPIANWIKQDLSKLKVVASYNLVFNASLLVDEGLGYAICLDKLINVSGDSNLCFRPLEPMMIAEASVIWKRYQVFSKAADCFLNALKQSLCFA